MNNLIALSLDRKIIDPSFKVVAYPLGPMIIVLLFIAIRIAIFVAILYLFFRKKNLSLQKKIIYSAVLVILFALTFFVEYALYNDYFSIKLIQSLL